MTTHEATPASLAMMFTDALGHVVFVDQTFLRLMNYAAAGKVAGEPLHKALGVDQKLIKGLLDDLRSAGHIQDRQIEVKTLNGAPLHVAFNGVATFDDKGTFIGADLTLQDIKRATSEIKMLDRGDIIKTRVQQMIEEEAPVEVIDYVQLYFKTQVGALYVLLVRLMGQFMLDQMDTVLNDHAASRGWSIQFRNGLFTLGAPPEMEMYCSLTRTAAAYAADLIGDRLVSREMQMVDANMDATTLEAAITADVRYTL